MRKLRTLMTSMLLMVICHAEAADFETAKEAVKNMGVGWNLGNTLDACSGGAQGLESETYWGQPVTKPELLKMMKEAGFGAIRVPVTWYNHMDADGKVDAAWMKRVHEVVDYVIDQGMYCIVNVHHDTGDGKQWLHASTTTYNSVKSKFEYLWRQIATEFKDYDQHLLFEAYNEMLDDNKRWNEPATDDGYKAINNYAKSFVTTVRNTGGNNKQRNLVVNTYSASNSANAMKALELPEKSEHIIFQLHSYPNWLNESNARSRIDNLMSNIKSNLLNRAPVIIGEYATLTTETTPNIEYYNTNRKVALYAMDYLVKQAKIAGIGTFYWMGLSDGSSRSLPVFNQVDLAETLIKAYYGSTNGYKFPSTTTTEIIYTVKYNDEWSEAFLYGDWNRTAVKLSNYKGIRLEMMDDSYADKLQIKVYGDKISGTTFKEQYIQLASGSATTEATFDTSVLGSTFWGITLQTFTGAQTAKVKKAILIKADGSEVPLTVTAAWGCEVNSEKVAGIHPIKADQTESDIYDLRGQRVQNPQKGIYIKNGKKFIKK